ncbi:DNA cytosine methyltransferase [Brachybacterium paraconglomeratum]
MPDYVLGEMFSGPGGIARGAEMANVQASKDGRASRTTHGWAVEYHPDTAQTYKDNIRGASDSSVFTADVRSFDLRSVPEFNAFAFGFPCNDFSTVGEHRGLDGEYGPLYMYGVHALALHRPDWFIAENVSGLSRANGGAAFGKILSALRRPTRAARQDPYFEDFYSDELGGLDLDLEYDLTANLYRFEEYGLPQKRHRILIVGIRRDVAEKLERDFRVPARTARNPRAQKSARVAIEVPPIPAGAPNHQRIKHSDAVVERLKAIAPGKNAFNTEFEDERLKLNVKGATLSNIYRRLDPDKPSYTVTGSGGGGTHMYHWDEPRALTSRERARLQTFDDSFVFHGSHPSVRRQIGMAVPPEGAELVIDAVLKTLDAVDYASEPPNLDTYALIQRYEDLDAEAEADPQLSIEEPAPDPLDDPVRRFDIIAGTGAHIDRSETIETELRTGTS